MTEGIPTAVRGLALAPGDSVAGKYVVEHTIASGGMGVVLAARHAQIQHRVALKVLLPQAAGEQGAARFLREAQNAMSIRSEHVARVMDVGTLAGGEQFLVMEYLEGTDLARLLERRVSLPAQEATGYVLQVLVALAEAHALGIVHRDLKPSNLFLTERPDGTPLVKVLDFGISKQIGPSSPQNLTATQGLIGSPLYMSPEQIKNARDVDERADIWGIGVILHELCSGKPPFTGTDVGGVLAAIMTDAPPPIESLKPDLPPGFGAVIRRCLQKARDERYADVGELAEALAPFAPPDAKTLVSRITGTSQRFQANRVSRASKPADVPVEAIAPLTKTTDAFSRSHFRSKGTLRWAGLAACLVAVGIGLAIWVARSPGIQGEAAASAVPGEAATLAAPSEPVTPAAPREAEASESDHSEKPSVTIEGPAAAAAPPASSAPASSSRTLRTRPPRSAVVAPKATRTAPKQSGARDVSELIDERL